MPKTSTRVDILIFGGGIAGLWTLARLRAAGYSCLLLEKHALGAGQTIASQGIIHGGIKYALTGAASRASRAIAEMPAAWRACIAGDGEVDLRGTRVLSDHQHLWTTGGIGARLVGAAASHAIRTPVEHLPAPDRPAAFAGAPRKIDLYRVPEPILDPRSLVERLSAPLVDSIIIEDSVGFARFTRSGNRVAGATVELAGPGEMSIGAECFILAAGEGNALLLEELQESEGGSSQGHRSAWPAQQRRPLHMVMARARNLPPLFGHCVGLSDKPRLTITSQQDAPAGERTVWYIGGQLAESGIARDREDQISAARRELSACLPWLDEASRNWEDTQFATLRIDRAEGLTEGGARPDEPVVVRAENVIAVWPTKLALAPLAAARVLESVKELGVKPGSSADLSALPRTQERAAHVAPLPWEEATLQWT